MTNQTRLGVAHPQKKIPEWASMIIEEILPEFVIVEGIPGGVESGLDMNEDVTAAGSLFTDFPQV